MKILIMEDEKLLKPPLPEALVILDVTAPGINSRQVAEEVETCIHSLLHRQEEETEALSFGNTSLELSTGMLRCGMKHVQLSAKEFEILRLLFQSGRKNLSKETILQKVWGYDTDAVENNVEVYVGFFKKEAGQDRLQRADQFHPPHGIPSGGTGGGTLSLESSSFFHRLFSVVSASADILSGGK